MSGLIKKAGAKVKDTRATGDAAYPLDVEWDTSDPCATCPKPCGEHGQVPDYLKIDDGPMVGSVKPYRRHLLFFSGQAKRWPAHLETASGSLAASLMEAAASAGAKLGYRIVVTAADAADASLPAQLQPPTPGSSGVAQQPSAAADAAAAAGAGIGDRASAQAGAAGAGLGDRGAAQAGAAGSGSEEGLQLLLLPDMVGVWLPPDVVLTNLVGAVKDFLEEGTLPVGALRRSLKGGPRHTAAAATPVQSDGDHCASHVAQPGAGTGTDAVTEAGPIGAAAAGKGVACSASSDGGAATFVLVCAHKLRDKRCGEVGPRVVEALRKEVDKRGLQQKVFVYPVSHTGGHKFAGNVLIYPGGHWYGRVTPCHAGPILDTHVLGGKVIKGLWRGRISGGDSGSLGW